MTDAIVEKALAGALPVPLFDLPPKAGAVKSALVKQNYGAAIAEAAKLPEADGGPELKKVIEGLVATRVSTMQKALKDGDFLTAVETASALKKGLDGLPEAPEPEKVLAEITANKDADRVIDLQKKVRAIGDQPLKKKKEIDKAIADLGKIVKDAPGTYAAKQADELQLELVKKKNSDRG